MKRITIEDVGIRGQIKIFLCDNCSLTIDNVSYCELKEFLEKYRKSRNSHKVFSLNDGKREFFAAKWRDVRMISFEGVHNSSAQN